MLWEKSKRGKQTVSARQRDFFLCNAEAEQGQREGNACDRGRDMAPDIEQQALDTIEKNRIRIRRFNQAI
jgi:hypothetical protein